MRSLAPHCGHAGEQGQWPSTAHACHSSHPLDRRGAQTHKQHSLPAFRVLANGRWLPKAAPRSMHTPLSHLSPLSPLSLSSTSLHSIVAFYFIFHTRGAFDDIPFPSPPCSGSLPWNYLACHQQTVLNIEPSQPDMPAHHPMEESTHTFPSAHHTHSRTHNSAKPTLGKAAGSEGEGACPRHKQQLLLRRTADSTHFSVCA